MYAHLSLERTKLIGWIMIALSGCSSIQPQKHLTETRAPPSSLDGPISRKVILFGDTQLHEFYGAPVFLGSLPADFLSKVAIRSAPQRLFGSEILKRIVDWNKHEGKSPIIHMGDAVDVSCMTEWRRFTKLMQNERSGVEWVLVPGNHDGYFEGVLYPNNQQIGNDWAKDRHWTDDRYGNLNWDLRCDAEEDLMRKAGARSKVVSADVRKEVRKSNLRKREFICEYLKLVDIEEPACNIELNAEEAGYVRKDQGHFLRRVAWRLARPQWQSFLLQVVDMSATDPKCGGSQCPRTWGILLDTSQYEDNPRFSWRTVAHGINRRIEDTSAGGRGEIRDDQAQRAKGLLREMENSFPGSRFVIFGHHDFESLTKKAKRFVAELIKEGAEPLYVSAHTHKGFWKTYDGFGDRPLVELNVGSLLDAPVHFRDFQLQIMNQKTVVHSEAHVFDETTAKPHESWNLTACPVLPEYGEKKSGDQRVQLNAWAKGSVLKGRGYNGRREVQIMNLHAELLEYEALLTAFPSSTNIDEDRKQLEEIKSLLLHKSNERLDYQIPLRRLGAYDEGRKAANSEDASLYKACLVVEAANYDTDWVTDKKHLNKELECAKRCEVELGTVKLPRCK